MIGNKYNMKGNSFDASMSPKILFMDDDDIIRDYAKMALESKGYTVRTAVNGEQAVDEYEKAIKKGEPFDGVILDIHIEGGMGGWGTLEKLRMLDPDVRAVVSSGMIDDSLMTEYQKHGFAAALPKPYTMENLHDAVSKLVNGTMQGIIQ